MSNIEELSERALDLIIQYEVGGSKKYYDRFLAKPSWPTGASGVTIGFGVDLGYESEILEDLKEILTSSQISRLKRVVGLRGSRAQQAVSGVRDILIPWDFAFDYFVKKTIPKYIQETIEAFPGSQELPDDAFGALVSIVFNRGGLIDSSDRRREMRNIRDILANDGITNDSILRIADEVEAMKRLWPDNYKSDNDLHDRREAEAELIRSCV